MLTLFEAPKLIMFPLSRISFLQLAPQNGVGEAFRRAAGSLEYDPQILKQARFERGRVELCAGSSGSGAGEGVRGEAG